MIKAFIETEDEKLKTEFDATPWFEKATVPEIAYLIHNGWRNADSAAEEISGENEKVGEIFQYSKILNHYGHDECGTNVSVDEETATAWLDIHRPGITEEMVNDELRVSSPDGAIDFTWCRDGAATALRVTKYDVEAYLWTIEGQDREGWWLMPIGGHWRLIHPVRRVNTNTVVLDGDEYQYNDVYWDDNALEVETCIQGRVVEVKNVSTLATIRFFLQHEAIINAILADRSGKIPV